MLTESSYVEWIANLKDAARYLLQNGQTKQSLAVQACVTMLEDDSADDQLLAAGRAVEGTFELRTVAGSTALSVGGRVREYAIEPGTGIIGAGDRKPSGDGRELEARTQDQAAKLEAFARSLEGKDGVKTVDGGQR